MWPNVPSTFILREIRSNRRKTFITVTLLGCIIISFFFSYVAFGEKRNTRNSLLSIHILFRHGDRTPSFLYPKDPYFNKSWSDGLGALTNKGKTQMFQLGRLIRSRYSNFLPSLYYSKNVVVKSSYSPRCQMSAATVLAGLFPPVGPQIWNEELLWQPIPVNPIPRDRDNILAAKATCQEFIKEKHKSDQELVNELSTEERQMFKYLEENTGVKVNDTATAESIFYTLNIESDNGLSLPEWTNKIFPEPLRTVAAINLASYTRTLKLKRLQSGPLLEEWLSHLELFLKDKSPLMYLYSGHDLTIVNAMRTLGLMGSVPWLPEYGASLILELEEGNETDENMIKVLYLNSSFSKEPNELKLSNCDLRCPLSKFIDLIKPFIPDDWEKECVQQS